MWYGRTMHERARSTQSSMSAMRQYLHDRTSQTATEPRKGILHQPMYWTYVERILHSVNYMGTHQHQHNDDKWHDTDTEHGSNSNNKLQQHLPKRDSSGGYHAPVSTRILRHLGSQSWGTWSMAGSTSLLRPCSRAHALCWYVMKQSQRTNNSTDTSQYQHHHSEHTPTHSPSKKQIATAISQQQFSDQWKINTTSSTIPTT